MKRLIAQTGVKVICCVGFTVIALSLMTNLFPVVSRVSAILTHLLGGRP